MTFMKIINDNKKAEKAEPIFKCLSDFYTRGSFMYSYYPLETISILGTILWPLGN